MAVAVIRAGKTVRIFWSLQDATNLPPSPYTPGSAPTCTIYDPTGSNVSSGSASTTATTGLYAYNYTTSAVGVLGDYTATLDVTDAFSTPSGSVDAPNLKEQITVFTLV
jgi:uncharacterized protein YfaS (alpha-2-macroglobulin family)